MEDRRSKGGSFSGEEVGMVIVRVAKGLKYLYQINHHHGNLTSSAISWPVFPYESIQLTDIWALKDNSQIFNQNRYDNKFSARDYMYGDDLYKLGTIAKEMLDMHPTQTKTKPGEE